MSSIAPAMPSGSEGDNRGPGFRSFLIFISVFVVVVVALRFWARSLLNNSPEGQDRRFWWDDWFALASVPIILCQSGNYFAMIQLGLGRHVGDVPPGNLTTILKLFFATYMLYGASLFLAKTSALLFLTRIFPHFVNRTWFNVVLWAAHALNLACFLGIILSTVFSCEPVTKYWDPTLSGTCWSTSVLLLVSSVPSVAIDLIILILPLPKIYNLHVTRARRAGITAVFVLGYCAIVVSLGRLITVLKGGEALDLDLTYEGVIILYWTGAECPTLLFGICIPAMWPLGRYLANSYFLPLGNMVSSLVSRQKSTRMSRSRDAIALSDEPSHSNVRLRTDNGHSTDLGIKGLGRMHSTDSRLNILLVSPRQDQYVANVRGGECIGTIPDRAIRVDNVVVVAYQGDNSYA